MNTEIEGVATTRVSKWTLLLRIKLSLCKHIQLLSFANLFATAKFMSKIAK